MTTRALSSAGYLSIARQETDEDVCVLVTLSHADLATPIRVCNTGPDLVSRGNTYTYLPFAIVFPADREDQLPQPSVQIDNVDRAIVRALRALSSAPSVSIEVVLRSQPDTLEFGPFVSELRVAPYDALTVEGQLSVPPILDEEHPQDGYTPDAFPGLFP